MSILIQLVLMVVTGYFIYHEAGIITAMTVQLVWAITMLNRHALFELTEVSKAMARNGSALVESFNQLLSKGGSDDNS